MRIALIVGINHYINCNPLYGCVNDAMSVKAALERHYDNQVNFDCNVMTAEDNSSAINRAELKDNVEELFKIDAEIALFYFAGHGHIEATGGYILASNSSRGDEGVSLTEVIAFANASPARNKVIILDSCHSGAAGNTPNTGQLATINEGVTVLTASTAEQYASEENGRGVFTTLLVDALEGSASNLTGDITPGSVYAHIDQSLGAWEQRPIFKTNVKQFVSLRKSQPAISIEDLRRITEFFPVENFSYKLDPTYEPELKGRDDGMPPPVEENNLKFAILQKYNRLNLLVPENAPHMWNAAMESKSCKLTLLGEHYRRLVLRNRV